MAGIGFVLRKLSRRDDLLGIIGAYIHSMLVSTGPWLFTVLAIGSVVAMTHNVIDRELISQFRLIIIYNFAFSLVLSGPIFMVVTRYLADLLYSKNIENIPGLIFGSFALLYGTQAPIVIGFYVFYLDIPPLLALSAVVNFLTVGGLWLVSVFITTLKQYSSITYSFLLGLLVAVICCTFLAQKFLVIGILNGFTCGLSLILFALLAKVISQYNTAPREPFKFLSYFKKYWELPVGGLIYNLAIWVDKWIMWTAPEAEVSPLGLISYPTYDGAMFLAYLTVIPLMAAFVFSIETSFVDQCLSFRKDIEDKAPLSEIKEGQKKIIQTLMHNLRNFLVLQGSICCFSILAAPKLFIVLGFNFMQLGIFRMGVLGSLFHIFFQLLIIFLFYFDSRKKILQIQILFLILNGICSFWSLKMGFPYYGFGYFLSSAITFLVAAYISASHFQCLTYHTFITSNDSIR